MVMFPAARWLFTARKVWELQGRSLKIFHSVVMKLLWIVHRGRTDFATSISYLCTRMKQPDIEDWKKLKRVLCFKNTTIENESIIGANILHEMQTYVYSYNSVHMDMKGHTGGVSTFDIGVLTANSSKHKMNSRISNKPEVIVNIKYLPYNIWYE